ncbi:hypothetical protein Droror1_Dr00001322 [Drosera rotundifolia]
MDDLRSRQYMEDMMQIETYQGGKEYMGPTPNGNLRSQSVSYAAQNVSKLPNELKRGKSMGVGSVSMSRALCFGDPELQRKKRVAGYKVYGVEGKVKGSFRKSFRWIKERCTQVVNGLLVLNCDLAHQCRRS